MTAYGWDLADSPYARTPDTVHRSTCRRAIKAKTAVPWLYAKDLNDEQVKALTREMRWLRLCKICRPGSSRVAELEQAS